MAKIGKVDISYEHLPGSKIKSDINSIFSDPQKLAYFEKLVGNLPSGITKVQMSVGNVETWQVDIVGSVLRVTFNPNSDVNIRSGDSLLSHEIWHKTENLNAMSAAAADAFIDAAPAVWSHLSQKYDNYAYDIVNYGFEEVFNSILNNQYRKTVGQELAEWGPFSDTSFGEMQAQINAGTFDSVAFMHRVRYAMKVQIQRLQDAGLVEGMTPEFDGGAFFSSKGRLNFIDFSSDVVTDIARLEGMIGGGIHNPDGTVKVANGGGFKFAYGPGSKFAGQDWQPGGDQDGDGDVDKQDKRMHDADLYDRIAKDAESEGKDWKADHYRSKADALKNEADAHAKENNINPGSRAPTSSPRPETRPDNLGHQNSGSHGGSGSGGSSSERASERNKDHRGHPILLDLDGNGVTINELARSTVFKDAGGDGLMHRTAWAGSGDGVLFFDADADGTLSQKREYVFTEWDPTAATDMEALRAYFDTNGDGKLTSADAAFAQFKVLVTNADGSTTVKTLAQLGITEINLTEDSTRIELPDGSVWMRSNDFCRSSACVEGVLLTSCGFRRSRFGPMSAAGITPRSGLRI